MNEYDDITNITDAEALNRQRIAGWWDLLGEPPAYPVSTDVVGRLLRAVEYLADNDRVLQAVNEEWFPPPERVAGRFAWTATNIVTLGSALEARRLWKPGSKIHLHKFSAAERIRHLCEADGGEFLNDLHEFDIEGLLGMLVQVSRDSGAVEVLAEAIREKLKREGVLS